MRFNSKIMLRGEKEPFYVSKVSANAVQKIWLDKSVPGDSQVTSGKKTFLKEAIRSVFIENDGLYGDEMSSNKNYDEEEKQKRDQFLAYSPERKAISLEFFKTLFKAMSGEDASDEVVSKAQSLQIEFYKNNPKRTLCDPVIFKELIPKRKMMDAWEDGVVRFIEAAVGRDINLANK